MPTLTGFKIGNDSTRTGWLSGIHGEKYEKYLSSNESYKLNQIPKQPGNVNWLNYRKPEFKDVHVQPDYISRPSVKKGTVIMEDKPVMSAEGIRKKYFRSGLGNHDMSRPAALRQPIKARGIIEFDKLQALDIEQSGIKTQLSEKTLTQLRAQEVYDPTDKEWIDAYNVRINAGESEASINRNPPMGRQQRRIGKMRLPTVELAEKERLQEIMVDRLNDATNAQLRALAHELNIPLQDVRTGVSASVDDLKEQILGWLDDIDRHGISKSLDQGDRIIDILKDIRESSDAAELGLRTLSGISGTTTTSAPSDDDFKSSSGMPTGPDLPLGDELEPSVITKHDGLAPSTEVKAGTTDSRVRSRFTIGERRAMREKTTGVLDRSEFKSGVVPEFTTKMTITDPAQISRLAERNRNSVGRVPPVGFAPALPRSSIRTMRGKEVVIKTREPETKEELPSIERFDKPDDEKTEKKTESLVEQVKNNRLDDTAYVSGRVYRKWDPATRNRLFQILADRAIKAGRLESKAALDKSQFIIGIQGKPTRLNTVKRNLLNEDQDYALSITGDSPPILEKHG